VISTRGPVSLPVVHGEAPAAARGLSYRSFWYVVCQSSALGADQVLGRKVLGEWLAVFRGPDGAPAAVRDRCKHRNAPLSRGACQGGKLQCPYHGWVYDHEGTVVAVPAEGKDFKATGRRAVERFATREQDGFVYVRLDPDGPADLEPFAMPHWGAPGWRHLRLENRFASDVTNCAENFIDIPHTAYVHPGIFRTERHQRIEAAIERRGGSVRVEYVGETSNLGWFARFLNPSGAPIVHRDSFHMPNVTEVEYVFGPSRSIYIISQSVPEEDDSTLVYTTLTYDFGLVSRNPWLDRITRRVLGFQGQRVIDQDLEALARQNAVIQKFGADFNNTSVDAIHVLVESIRDELLAGRDPRALPDKRAAVTFWV
jgi:phenylpropionate dioxygenase-like ring-hydroxylating dioxygenase large terminal subunit